MSKLRFRFSNKQEARKIKNSHYIESNNTEGDDTVAEFGFKSDIARDEAEDDLLKVVKRNGIMCTIEKT